MPIAETTVRHGPRTDLLAVVLIFPTLVAVLVFLLLDLSPRGFNAGYIATNDGIASLGVLLLVTVMNLLRAPEEVNLRSSGIRVWTRLSGYGREAPWARLRPVPGGWISLGFVMFRWSNPGGGFLSEFQLSVSPAQARAILAHPLCPRAPLPPPVLRRLGLPDDWDALERPLGMSTVGLVVPAPTGDSDAVFRREWMRKRTHDIRVGAGFGGTFVALAIAFGLLGFQGGPNPLLIMAGLCAVGGSIWWGIAWKLRKSMDEFGSARTDSSK